MLDTRRWILVVEDNPDDELVARRAFQKSSRTEELIVANDGHQALQILKDPVSPALVLLDLKLPRLSGIDVLMSMKDDDRLRRIPVVILTSSNDITDIAATYDLGCNAYVQKPVDYSDFLSTFRSTLNFWLDCNITMPSFRLSEEA